MIDSRLALYTKLPWGRCLTYVGREGLREKHVTPHTFRHTAAVHLVAAGVDVTVIQSWLGHAHLDTTFLYAQANIETKRRAIEQADGCRPSARPPRWKREPAIMAWLDSL